MSAFFRKKDKKRQKQPKYDRLPLTLWLFYLGTVSMGLTGITFSQYRTSACATVTVKVATVWQVSFLDDDGTLIGVSSVYEGRTVKEIPDMESASQGDSGTALSPLGGEKVFTGWSLDGETVVNPGNIPVDRDLEFTAVYEITEVYEIMEEYQEPEELPAEATPSEALPEEVPAEEDIPPESVPSEVPAVSETPVEETAPEEILLPDEGIQGEIIAGEETEGTADGTGNQNQEGNISEGKDELQPEGDSGNGDNVQSDGMQETGNKIQPDETTGNIDGIQNEETSENGEKIQSDTDETKESGDGAQNDAASGNGDGAQSGSVPGEADGTQGGSASEKEENTKTDSGEIISGD